MDKRQLRARRAARLRSVPPPGHTARSGTDADTHSATLLVGQERPSAKTAAQCASQLPANPEGKTAASLSSFLLCVLKISKKCIFHKQNRVRVEDADVACPL